MQAAMTQVDSIAEIDAVLAAAGGVHFLDVMPSGCISYDSSTLMNTPSIKPSSNMCRFARHESNGGRQMPTISCAANGGQTHRLCYCVSLDPTFAPTMITAPLAKAAHAPSSSSSTGAPPAAARTYSLALLFPLT